MLLENRWWSAIGDDRNQTPVHFYRTKHGRLQRHPVREEGSDKDCDQATADEPFAGFLWAELLNKKTRLNGI